MTQQTNNNHMFNSREYTVLLFYKYTDIENPDALMKQQKAWCEELELTGRTIIANEGINSTLEGMSENIKEYISRMSTKSEFKDIHWKKSPGTGATFPKISIKVRDEIVSTHLESKTDIGPHRKVTGKYITPIELHTLINSTEEFYIVDMRNDYEFQVGHFEGSIMFQNMSNFRDLPKVIGEISHLKDKKIVTVCTGGVRCEKASGLLLLEGFSDVSQLAGGIVSYMEQYPNQDFLGKLYVFDKRLVMGFNTDSKEHTIVGKCRICGTQSENIVDYYSNNTGERKHGIVCEKCILKENIVIDPPMAGNSIFQKEYEGKLQNLSSKIN
jgi:UPF0176 protein